MGMTRRGPWILRHVTKGVCSTRYMDGQGYFENCWSVDFELDDTVSRPVSGGHGGHAPVCRFTGTLPLLIEWGAISTESHADFHYFTRKPFKRACQVEHTHHTSLYRIRANVLDFPVGVAYISL